MTGVDLIEGLACTINPIREILKDERLKKIDDSKDLIDYLPDLLKYHKVNIVKILAGLNGESFEEYNRTLTLRVLINDLTKILKNEDVKDFFSTLLQAQEQ